MEQMNLIHKYNDLTKEEKDFLCDVLNYFRLNPYLNHGANLPEIHHGNLIFVGYERIVRLLQECSVAHTPKEPWPKHQKSHIQLIKKWNLAPQENVILHYGDKLK